MKSMFLTASAILALIGVSFAATAYINQVGYPKDWNRVKFDSQEFKDLEQSIFASVKEVSANA